MHGGGGAAPSRPAEASSTFQATSFQNEHFVRGLLNFSSDKLPKRAFRARPPQLFKQQASKTSVSCEASSTFQATSFQSEHFVRGILNFSSNKLSKRAFRARPPQLFKQQASKTSVSCEASSTFQATSFQSEHFVRGILNFSSNKLSKRAFRARPPQLFKQQASKTSVSCEASSTFQATSFQNEHFVRGLLNFSSNKLSKRAFPARPLHLSNNKLQKRAFRAKPLQLFKRQVSKTSISCEASSTFQATSFQNEHFVRGLLNFSSDKLPKRAFRARPPKEQTSKASISCEASSTFQTRSFQNLAPATQNAIILVAFPRPPARPPGDVPRNNFAEDVSRNNFGSLSARPPARRRVQK